MTKLFLHIGFAKTGTTTIQSSLVRNAARLREQSILYPANPAASFVQNIQHLPLAMGVPGRNGAALSPEKQAVIGRAYQDLFQVLATRNPDTLVLSSEAFGALQMTHERVAWLREVFSEFDVTIVAYIRRQDDHHLSTYQEAIKTGGSHVFEFKKYRAKKVLYFAQRLAPWRDVFGPEKVIVRPFVRTLWHGGDLFLDFLNVIGAKPEGIAPVRTQNESLDYRALEVLRRLNQISERHSPEMSAYDQRRQGYLKLAKRMPEVFDGYTSFQKAQLSTEQSEEIRVFFREENRKALSMTDVAVDAFFPPAPSGQTARIQPGTIDDELLMRMLWAMTNPDAVRAFRFLPGKVPSAD